MLYNGSSSSPPGSAEFEISLFGTGYGESVLCHFGDNEWAVIDSCTNPESNKSLILEYLEQTAPDAKVLLIIATHFHDDHIRGLSQIVERYPGACFVFPNALKGDEFIQLLVSAEDILVNNSSCCKEFYSILKLLQKDPKSASEAKKIFSNKYCDVYSLSPSDHAEAMAREEIKGYLPREGLLRKSIVPNRTNHFSIVVKCVFKNKATWLLGSDLENHTDTRWGWRAIILSKLIPDDEAHVFKIPHHGSDCAHNDDVWQNLLVKNPISLITPFVNGKTIIPSRTSLNRIKDNSYKAFITGRPERKKTKNSDSTVRRILKEAGKEIFTINSQVGHIQLRMDFERLDFVNSCVIKTFGSALDVINF